MKTISYFFLSTLWVSPALAATRSPETDIEAAFSELRELKSMRSGQVLTLPANGASLTGRNDDFLRRRTAGEIRASGLSSGCGDYALVFIDRIESRGYETLLIDAAQISSISLAGHDAGHAVVAIRPKDRPDTPWWLVDSTARKLISRHWAPTERSFSASGHVYWIGYCGPLAKYPVHNHEELKRFYADTLAKVPLTVFNHTLYRFTFKIDALLEDGSGGYLNPRVKRMQTQHDELFARYHIKPEREVSILLTRGGNDAAGRLDYLDHRWVASVGLKSACSPGLVTYFEQRVRLAETNL